MYVTVTILEGTKRIFPWTMYLCSEEHTFAALFEDIRKQFSLGDLRTDVVNCSISKTLDSVEKISVDLGFNVTECCAINGRYVRFITEKDSNSAPLQNAATVLMASASKLRLPSKLLSMERYEKGRGDYRLHDDIIDFLDRKNLGFGAGLENTTGKQVVKALADTLFFLQPHLKTINGRIPNFIPSYFACVMEKSYNDPTAHKHSVPPIKCEILGKLNESLYSVLLLPAIQSSRWKDFTMAVRILSDNCHKYVIYLEEKAKVVQQNHLSPTPIRSALDGKSSNLKFIVKADVRRPCIIARYKALEEQLLKSEEPVFLNDFAPINARLCYIYLHEISLPFRIEVYTYHHGNNLGSLWYAWQVPSNPELYDPNKSQQMISWIQQNISQYHSREMRRQFCHRFGLILKARSSVMMELYQFLTGDVSVTTIEEHVKQKLKFMLDSQDPEVVYDLRDINPGRPEMYKPFWDEVKALINEKSLAAVDSRRHGTTCHMAFAFSVRDLRDQVVKRSPSLDVPSLEWIRAQFWPRNPFHSSSSSHTGRLEIKFMVQSRQLHADHPDSHYRAAILKYMKQFAIMFRDYTTMVSLDDKHNIKIGEPNFPVAAVDRGKEVLVGLNSKFMVGDHDFTKAKFTPSVALVCDIPEDIGESFYRGKVCVTLKDAIFQASSPKRHAAELKKILLALTENINPLLCIYTDGGPDHRNTYLSVQISLIALFISIDLDMLVVARTAPQNSYRNPVERVMSLLNIGLQAVGVMRQEMAENFEKVIHGCNSMQEIRTAATKNTGFKDAFSDSLQPAICLLDEVFSRLNLKGEPVQTQTPCTEEAIHSLWECIHEVDPTVEVTDSRQEHVKTREQLLAFMNHCCIKRQYIFCIKKCGVVGCKICKSPRLPPDVFEKLSLFPDPMKKTASESYKDFTEVWGKTTSESDRPSLSLKKSKEKSAKPFRMTAETVCDVIVCGECLKPRCVYSKKKLSKNEHSQLQILKQDYFYCCGGTIFPENSDIKSLCCIELLTSCNEDVSPHYFAAKFNNSICCYHCGAYGDLRTISEEMRRRYQTVHPVCNECYAIGFKERTRGPRFCGQKRKRNE